MNPNYVLDTLNAKCSNITNLTIEQQTKGLEYEPWLNVTKLIASVSPHYAIRFSSLSKKHNDESEEKIMAYKDIESNKLYTNCTTLGCSREDIEICQKRVNEKDGRITNSPISFLKRLKTDDIIMEEKKDVLRIAITKTMNNDSEHYKTEEVMKALVYLSKYNKPEVTKFKSLVVSTLGINKTEFNAQLKEAKQKFPLELSSMESSQLADQLEYEFTKNGKLMSLNGIKFSEYILDDYKIVYDKSLGFYNYDSGLYTELDINEISRIIKSKMDEVQKYQWKKDINDAIVESLKVHVPQTSKMNEGIDYINMKNGLYNIRTFKLEDHDPSIFSICQVPYAYNPDAVAPSFVEYLRSTFDDELTINLVQELLGYCLTREVKAEKFFVLLGEGSNGKSVFINLIKNLVGSENAVSVSLRALDSKYNPALLHGKLVNIPSENETIKGGFNTELLKSITSGDSIQGEMKYKNPFFFTPYATQIFAMNRLMFINDKSYGLERRMIIIPFDSIFKADVQESDPDYIKKIDIELKNKLESELPGIFNFAIDGLKRLIENNFQFTHVPKISGLLNNYKKEINHVFNFYSSEIILTNGSDKITSKKLKGYFTLWCEDLGLSKSKEMSTINFLKEFRAIFKTEGRTLRERKSNGEIVFEGLAIRTHEYNMTYKNPIVESNGYDNMETTDGSMTNSKIRQRVNPNPEPCEVPKSGLFDEE